MTALLGLGRELVGLFVDDGLLAVLAIGWVGVTFWLLPLVASPAACGVLLFAGLVAILAVSVLRA